MVQDLARARADELIPREVLVHVPGFGSGGVMAHAARLHGGTVNTIFRVDTSAGRFVVRLHHEVARTLGANHEREAHLHAAAAAAGLAPSLIHVDAGYRFMVMEHVAGSLWSSQDFARRERLTQLGAALQSLHAVVPPSVAPFDLPAVLRSHHERLSEAAPAERAWLATLMERAAAALDACGSRQRPQVLVHNDLYHSNLIGTERLYLLDWEYGAVADPLFDLASALAYYPHAAAHAEAFLDASGLAGAATPEMLRHATWLFVLVSYFWYRSRRLAGPPDSPVTLAAEQSLLKRLG
jgi:aminoglycoside phosphotransferase (APT) family kinase protein